MNKFNLALAAWVLALGWIAYSSVTVPSAPTNVKVEYKNSCNLVTWTDTSSNEDWFILWKLDGQWNWQVTNAWLKRNWYYYNDCNINTSETYTYAITSFNRAWASSFSNQVSTVNNQNQNLWMILNEDTSWYAPVVSNTQNQNNWIYDQLIWHTPMVWYNWNNGAVLNNWNNNANVYNNSSIPTVSNFVAIPRANWTVLTWKADNNPNYFEIYRNTGWRWIKVSDVSWNYRSFFDNNCQDWVSSYAIRAWNGAKWSDISSRKYWNWIYGQYQNYAPAPVTSTSSSYSYSSYAPAPAPVYTNWSVSNFSASIDSSQNTYSTVVLSWNYNWNNPATYFVLERKSDWNDFEPVANVEFYQNQNSYTYKTTISYNTNYTYRLRAYTNGQYSNEQTATIYRAQSQPAPVNPPVYSSSSSSSSSSTCWTDGCNKCNWQEGCYPDFYFGKCYFDREKDLLYVDVCNGWSDYDFGYYNNHNFMYYYNNLASQTFNYKFSDIFRGWSCETKSFKVWTSYVKTNMWGPFVIKIQLDQNNNIQESNERNNEFVYTIR